MPGTDVTDWKAGESGIHCWGLNLTEPVRPFLFLKFPRSKLLLISADTAAVKDLLAFLAIIRRASHHLHHQTSYQTYQV